MKSNAMNGNLPIDIHTAYKSRVHGIDVGDAHRVHLHCPDFG